MWRPWLLSTLLLALPLAALPPTGAFYPCDHPFSQGPDGGYGTDAPNRRGQSLPVSSGTHCGRIDTTQDADVFRILTIADRTERVLIQLFGTQECILGEIHQGPDSLSATLVLKAVLCEGEHAEIERKKPDGQWFISMRGAGAPTDYRFHLQVDGGL